MQWRVDGCVRARVYRYSRFDGALTTSSVDASCTVIVFFIGLYQTALEKALLAFFCIFPLR